MREPRWTHGAYASSPSLRRVADKTVFAEATVECWRGTPEEFVDASRTMIKAIRDGGSATETNIVTSLANGTSTVTKDISDLLDVMSRDVDSLISVRVEVKSTDSALSGVLVGRPRIPGLRVQVRGDDPSKALGIVELTFRRMMIGYVDRLGGIRAPIALLSAVAPMLLIGIAATPGDGSLIGRMVTLGIAVASCFALLYIGLNHLRVSQGFSCVAEIPTSGMGRVSGGVKVVYANRYVKSVFGVAWVVILGACGSKLAEFIPWP